METTNFYMYDGSFQGFLTAAGEALEMATPVEGIGKASTEQPPLFVKTRRVLTHRHRAERLWQKLERRSPALSRLIYFSFMSEVSGVELLLYNYINALFNINNVEEDVLSEWRQRLEGLARKVESEKRELERSLLFTPSAEGIPCAFASPSANVLPLLTRYFKSRFAGQAWMIYDSKRNYGIYWRCGQLELIGLRPQALPAQSAQATRVRSGHEPNFKMGSLRSLLLPKVLEGSLSGASNTTLPVRSAV